MHDRSWNCLWLCNITLFEKYQIKSKSLIRIIRNADIDVDEAVDDEDTDYRDMMEKLIRQRKKLCPLES
mgnify:FL=1